MDINIYGICQYKYKNFCRSKFTTICIRFDFVLRTNKLYKQKHFRKIMENTILHLVFGCLFFSLEKFIWWIKWIKWKSEGAKCAHWINKWEIEMRIGQILNYKNIYTIFVYIRIASFSSKPHFQRNMNEPNVNGSRKISTKNWSVCNEFHSVYQIVDNLYIIMPLTDRTRCT